MDLFPTAASVFERFADLAIDQPRKRKLFLSLLNLFGITNYAEINRRKMISLAERGVNPFDIHTVPNVFSGVYPEFSASVLFEQTSDPVPQRAAKLVLSTLAYRRSWLDNSLQEEATGRNDRNSHLFGRVANVRKTGLNWIKDVKHCNSSRHIVVAVNGAFFKLDVIDGGGAVISAEHMLRNINSIIRAAARDRTPPTPYGIITANIARPIAGIFYAEPLDASIRSIDEAIFLLAIDTNESPGDENEAGQALHIRNHHNRDYRKSLQLVVMENGFSGVTINLFAGVEGVLTARFSSWITAFSEKIPTIVPENDSGEPLRLKFETIDFNALPVADLKKTIATFSCNLPLIKQLNSIGKDGMKQLNVSPDAFFHAAMHLAYYERFKKVPSVHNLADMRGITFGSITRYLSTTSELTAFLENQTKPALLKALEAHKKKVGLIKSGGNPIHYAYYYLYTTVAPRPVLAIILFRLFVPDLFTRHISPDIWASNIPALPGIFCVGRFGIFFKAARKNCLVGHYLLFPDHVKICFLSNERNFLEAWQFDRAIDEALTKLKQLLSRADAPMAQS